MPQTILGIDIGSYSVKVTQLERGFGEFKVLNFFELPLIASESLDTQQAGVHALSKFFQEHPIVYDYVVLALPGQNLASRRLEMPFTNRSKILQTVGFELEDYVPFDIDEVLIEYFTIESAKSYSKINILYLLRSQFEIYLENLQNHGLEPRYIGVDSVELSNLAHTGALPVQGNYVILDIGHKKTNIVYMTGSQLKAVRSINIAGYHFTQAIAKVLDIPFEEAEEIKHKKGQVGNSDDPEMQALKEVVQSLLRQIKQTLFSFYEKGEKPIDALYFCGGSSRLLGMDNFLSHALKVNVSPLEVIDEENFHISDRESARAVIPGSLGIALRAIFTGKVADVNFRRGDFAYTKDLEALGGAFKKTAILFAVVLILGFTHFFTSYYSLSSQVKVLDKNLAKMVGESLGSNSKKKDSSLNAKKIKKILDGRIAKIKSKMENIDGDTNSAFYILKEISESLPKREEVKIDVMRLTITEVGHVTMKVDVDDFPFVDRVEKSLAANKKFSEVSVGKASSFKGRIRFEVNFNYSKGEN